MDDVLAVAHAVLKVVQRVEVFLEGDDGYPHIAGADRIATEQEVFIFHDQRAEGMATHADDFDVLAVEGNQVAILHQRNLGRVRSHQPYDGSAVLLVHIDLLDLRGTDE